MSEETKTFEGPDLVKGDRSSTGGSTHAIERSRIPLGGASSLLSRSGAISRAWARARIGEGKRRLTGEADDEPDRAEEHQVEASL